MLLKGENIPSSEGFPGQEDSSVEERQVSAEPHAPHLFPLERFLVQPQGNVLAVDPQVHGKHALVLGTQPVDRIEETMGSRVLRVHRLLPAPGEAAAEVPHVVIDSGAGGYMSEKSIPRIPCPCQSPASEPEKHMAAGVDAGRDLEEVSGQSPPFLAFPYGHRRVNVCVVHPDLSGKHRVSGVFRDSLHLPLPQKSGLQ